MLKVKWLISMKNNLWKKQPRNDYLEMLELTVVFLGQKQKGEIKFRSPGPMHQAHWRSIRILKTFKFRSQFNLTETGLKELRELNIFVAKVYIKAWFMDSQASKIPDLILLILFDPEIELTKKKAMINLSLKRDSMETVPRRPDIHQIKIMEIDLADFVKKRSRNIFAILCLPDGFLSKDPDIWINRNDIMAALTIAQSSATTNDHAEQYVTSIQECTKSDRFRNEDQLQFAMQVIESNRKEYPNAKKST